MLATISEFSRPPRRRPHLLDRRVDDRHVLDVRNTAVLAEALVDDLLGIPPHRLCCWSWYQ
jgi:hypothetical protein